MKKWSIFGVNVTPKFTKEDKNILKVNSKKEIFFDVFECKFNGEDIIVEQVGETDGLPIVRFETIKDKTKLVCEAILVEDNECGFFINEDNLEFVKNIETSPVKTLIQEEIEKTLPVPVNTVYEDKVKDISKKIIAESEEKAHELYEIKLQQYKDKKQKIADQAEKYLTEKSESIKRELNEQYIDFLSNNDENVRKLIESNIADITSTIDGNINDVLSKIDKLSDSNKQELTKILSENIVSINNSLDNKIKDLNDQLDIILHDSNIKLNKLDEKTSQLLEKNIKHTDEIAKNITSKIEQVDEKIEDYKIDTFKHVVENKSEIENSLNDINSKFKRVDEKIEDYKIDTFKHVVEKVADNKTEIEASLKNTISEINEQVDIKRDEVEKILAAELSNINEKLNIFSEEEDKKYKQLLENLNNLNKGEVKEILSEKINDKQLNSLKLDISKQFQNEMMSIKRLIEMSSGGGSVAKQFANGGTMDGSLNVTQNILSGGTNLLDIFNTDTSIDLQDVTDNGNTTTNSISSSSTLYGNDVVTNTVEFNTDAGVIVEPGQLAWNAEDLTLDLGMDTNVTLQVGQEQVLRVKCKDPLGVFDGMPVYAADTTGGSDNIEISRFSAVSGGVDEIYFIGVATEDIPQNGIGFVTTFGKVREVDGRAFGINNGVKDPADTSDWAFGNVLWVSPNIAGTLTTIKPPAPNRRIPIAMVLKAPNQQNITLMVRAEHGYNLDDIHNVKYDNLQNNDLLNYNSSLSAWENTSDININSVTSNEGSFTTLNALTANFTQTIVSTTSALSVINDGTGPALYVQQSGNEPVATFVDKEGGTVIIDDGGNVGIGTDTPASKLQIVGGDLDVGQTGENVDRKITIHSQNEFHKRVEIGYEGGTFGIRPQVGNQTFVFGSGSINNMVFASDAGTGVLRFKTANSEAMRIDSDGNVGIGTDSPSAKLDVKNDSDSIGIEITQHTSQTENPFEIKDSNGTTRAWITPVAPNNNYYSAGTYLEVGGGSNANPCGIRHANAPTQKYLKLENGSGDGEWSVYDEGLIRSTRANGAVLRFGYTNGSRVINPQSTTVGWTVRGAASQTANLQEWVDFNGNILSVVDADGNVGIGADNPNEALTVSGNISASGSITSNGITSNGDLDMNGNSIVNVASGSITFEDGASIGSSGTGNLSLSGNVGIGTDSPDNIFHISQSNQNAYTEALIENTATLGAVGFEFKTSTYRWKIGVNTNDQYRIRDEINGDNVLVVEGGAGQDALRIIAGGNVGIGTNTPSAKLDVAGIGKLKDGIFGNTDVAISADGGVLYNGSFLSIDVDEDYDPNGDGTGREGFMTFKKKTSNSKFSLINGTNAANVFIPTIIGQNFDDNRMAYLFRGFKIDNPRSGSKYSPAMSFEGLNDSGNALNNSAIASFANVNQMKVLIYGDGRIWSSNNLDTSTNGIEDMGAYQLRLDTRNSSTVGARINLSPTHTADAFQIFDSNNNGLFVVDSTGNVGIGTDTPSAKLEVVGHFTATTKSFLVDKPNGGKLQYGVTESNEHSVFVRGKTDQETINLPEEWEWLVDENSVTVTVTPVGKFQPLYVISQSNNEVKVGGVEGEYNYIIYGTRKDVAPLEVNV